MKDNISPEEKLLRLIKGEKKIENTDRISTQNLTQDIKQVKATSGLKAPSNKSLAPSLGMPYFSFFKKFLMTLVVLSFFYLIASFIYPLTGFSKARLPAITEEEKVALEESEYKSQIKPYEFYLQGIENRNIFGDALIPETTESNDVGVNDRILDIIENISLVGIISSEPSQAVIENKKTKSTYYLHKGQYLGELEVEDIQEGKVILNYKGQKYELYL